MFQEMGIELNQAFEDADILIVNTAISKSAEYEAVKIIGEDTDLMILLTQFCAENANIYIEKRQKKNSIHS